jgi:hypothetical protein
VSHIQILYRGPVLSDRNLEKVLVVSLGVERHCEVGRGAGHGFPRHVVATAAAARVEAESPSKATRTNIGNHSNGASRKCRVVAGDYFDTHATREATKVLDVIHGNGLAAESRQERDVRFSQRTRRRTDQDSGVVRV